MPTSSVSSQSQVWGVAVMERADGVVFYKSIDTPYDTNDAARSLWETLRFKYCLLSKYENIPEHYRTGIPVPKNLAVANMTLLGKVILKEVKKWLKERF